MKRNNYKNLLLLLLVIILVLFSSGCGENKEILLEDNIELNSELDKGDLTAFNGISFGTPLKDVMPQISKMLEEQNYNGETEEKIINSRFFEIIEIFNDVKIDDNIAKLTLRFVNVAHPASIQDCKFWLASYDFDFPTQYKAEEVIDYYREKFTQLYGEPTSVVEQIDMKGYSWETVEKQGDHCIGECSIYFINRNDHVNGNITFQSLALYNEYI